MDTARSFGLAERSSANKAAGIAFRYAPNLTSRGELDFVSRYKEVIEIMLENPVFDVKKEAKGTSFRGNIVPSPGL